MDFKIIYDHPQFSYNDLHRIESLHLPMNFKKGEIILKEGQVAKEYYCIESGVIRTFTNNYKGNEITTGFFCKQEIAIEPTSLFMNTPARENMQALVDCKVYKITFEEFQKLFLTVDHFSEWGRSWMTKTLLASKQRSLSIMTDSAKDRYIMLLESGPDIIKHAPLKQIASYLGITDSTLSKIRRDII